MTLTQLALLIFISLAGGWLLPARWRTWALALLSLLAIYWLQPAVAVRGLDFWLPTAALGLALLTWAVCRPLPETLTEAANQPHPGNLSRADIAALAIVLLLVLLAALNRYLPAACCLTPGRPPQAGAVLVGLGVILALALLGWRLRAHPLMPLFVIFLLVSAFIALKSEPLSRLASAALRSATGQDAALASALDLRWLGYSYLAFRLLHVLRDAQEKKRYPASLPEFLAYALFFPAYTSGPIDRLPRFLTDLREAPGDLRQEALDRRLDLRDGSLRLLQGTVKKYVLADTLALFSLNAANALQVSSPVWMWLLLYAYALRLYLDFSGYTDIAIGLGRWLGIRLPENFNAPYLKTNLTSFWNAWHITLAQWFRAYFFNPLTRWLRTRPSKPPTWAIILTGQVGVMLLIGLWHGLTWNFALWGLWHAAGLFVHNRWSEWQRARASSAPAGLWAQRLLSAGGWLLTFNFTSLGWVWFALPDVQTSLHVFRVLTGLQP